VTEMFSATLRGSDGHTTEGLTVLLRRSEAARYVVENYGIPCAPKTLAKLACVSSEGPRSGLLDAFLLKRAYEIDSNDPPAS